MSKPDALELDNQQMQYIARISHGKDSLKMLDVIVSRGLPLDRITTTDIWATDTIRGEHPKMVAFKERADEYIWQKYHIEVEHLCAMRNGEKVTYEKMFYHVPKRKEGRKEGTILGFPMLRGTWCQSALKRRASEQTAGFSCTNRELVQETQNRLYTVSQCPSTAKEHGAKNSKRVFRKPRREGRKKYRGIYRHCGRRAETLCAA